MAGGRRHGDCQGVARVVQAADFADFQNSGGHHGDGFLAGAAVAGYRRFHFGRRVFQNGNVSFGDSQHNDASRLGNGQGAFLVFDEIELFHGDEGGPELIQKGIQLTLRFSQIGGFYFNGAATGENPVAVLTDGPQPMRLLPGSIPKITIYSRLNKIGLSKN